MPLNTGSNFIKAVKKIVSKESANKKQSPETADPQPGILAMTQAVFQNLAQAYLIISQDGKIFYTNPAFLELAALKNAPRALTSVFEKQDILILQQAMAEGERGALTLKLRRGKEAEDCTAAVTFMEEENGTAYFALNLAPAAQQGELQRTNNLLESILNHAPMAIYTRGLDGKLTFWNKKTAEIFEEEDAGVSDDPHKNQTKRESEEYKKREAAIIKEGKVVVYPQEYYTTRRGNRVVLHIIKIPLPAAGGAAPCVLTIARDITEQHAQEQEMSKTRHILQSILDNAPVAIYARGESGEMLFKNAKASEIPGFTEEAAPPQTAERYDFCRKRELALFKSAQPLDLPAEEYPGAGGKKRFVHVVKVPVFTYDGNPLMVITIGEDITSVLSNEREALRSKNFLQEVIDNLPVALYAKKYSGEYILWNKKSAEVFGKAAKEVIGKTHHNDAVSPEQEEFASAQDKNVFDSGKELDIPQELISTQNGAVKIMHTVKTPLFNGDGTPNCLLAISEDITAKTKMEKQVYESRAKYSLLVENSPGGVLVIEQGKINFANKTLLSALGYGEEELIGRSFQDLVAKGDKETAEEFYEKVNSGTAARDFAVIRMQNKEGDAVAEFEASAAVSKYLGKKIVIMFLRNITKERRMENTVKSKDDKFRSVFESAATPFIVLQQNGYVYAMNRAARDLFGFTIEDKPLYSSLYIKPGLPMAARKAMAALQPCLFEARVDFDRLRGSIPGILKTGTLDLNISAMPVNERTAQNGSVISDYLLELSLKTPTDNYHEKETITGQDILSYRDGVLLCSREGLVLKTNPQAAQLLGLSLDKIQGKHLADFFTKEDAALIQADIKELYSQGSIRSRSYSLKTPGGNVAVEAGAMLASGNNFLISFRNETAKKQLTDLLKERSAQLEALTGAVDGALFECDIEKNVFSNFTNVNEAAETLTGLHRVELLSISLADALDDSKGSERKKVLAFLATKARQLESGKIIAFEARLQFRDKLVFCTVRISAFEAAGRQRAIIIMRDSSKEKILQNELSYKRKELSGLKNALPGLYLTVDKEGIIQEYKTSDMGYLIAAFPTDFVGRKPSSYLDKVTNRAYLDAIKEVIKTGIAVQGSFTIQYSGEYRFYEATISPIKGEENVIVLVTNVDRRKGLENKIHDLYAISSNRESDFVKNMDDILEFGKAIFGAEVGLISHFSGDNRENILINYATENRYKIDKGIETPVEACYEPVRNGQIFACNDTLTLPCGGCLHIRHDISSMLSAPLYLGGRVEGAITFLTVDGSPMQLTQDDKDFMGFIGGLMSMALELRQAKKAVDSGLSTFKKLISALDTPAIIVNTHFEIKNANHMLFNLCGVYGIDDLEDKNLFNRLTPDSVKTEGDFRSAYKISRGGVFDMTMPLILSDGKPFNLLWHVVEIKDSKDKVRGFLLVSESIKDIAALRAYIRPQTHT